MKIKLSKLIDFDKITCTIHLDEPYQMKKDTICFFVRIDNEQIPCKLNENRMIQDQLFFFQLRLQNHLTLDQLRKKITLFACMRDSVSNSRVKKIEIVEHFANKVKDVNFFPEINDSKTIFKLFSPFAESVSIKFFNNGSEAVRDMSFNKDGYWIYTQRKNLHLHQYKYIVKFEDRVIETIDPFSLSLTENSNRSSVIDFNRIQEITDFKNPRNHCDVVLYETHIRDFTSDPETAFDLRNSYQAFVQQSITKNDFPVGIDHLKELGITHVHLLPIQDFNSVDDLHPSDYNWGYDPKCYTVPEGSYSSNPCNPLTRVEEFSEMVDNLHQMNLGLILDVVYNHTYNQYDSIFNSILPDYAYRWNDWGELSNGSGCGNEIASERVFVQKYIIDSLKHWLTQYKVDGFRFDLMGLMDKDTMFAIEKELSKIKKDIILYGEPWTGGDSTLPEEKRSLKGFQRNHHIAVFNDDLRNGLKGYPDDSSRGFISGDINWTNNVLGSMLGGFGYEEGLTNITNNPVEQIVYASCHDNLTLFDKLKLSCPDVNWNEQMKMNKLTAFIYLLSFGIPFIHSGEEFARSKYLHNNTYNLGDIYNTIKWSLKEKHHDLFVYYKNLLKIRNEHPLFRLCTQKEVKARVNLIHLINGAFLYTINGKGIDSWNHCLIAINMTDDDLWFKLPITNDHSEWTITVNPFHSGSSPLGIAKDELLVGEKSWYLLHQ